MPQSFTEEGDEVRGASVVEEARGWVAKEGCLLVWVRRLCRGRSMAMAGRVTAAAGDARAGAGKLTPLITRTIFVIADCSSREMFVVYPYMFRSEVLRRIASEDFYLITPSFKLSKRVKIIPIRTEAVGFWSDVDEKARPE